MASKPVKPVVHPTLVVKPCTSEEFALTDQEIFLFDCIATEHTNIAGTEVDIYQLSKKKTVRDPLYDENITEGWDGPYRLKGWVEYPLRSAEVRSEGFRETFPSTLWVARLDVERVGARAPSYGDVVHFWKTPYFDETSVPYAHGKAKHGYYFTITDINEDGHLFDQASFVGFKASLARNTEFTPERRLTNT